MLLVFFFKINVCKPFLCVPVFVVLLAYFVPGGEEGRDVPLEGALHGPVQGLLIHK